MVPVTVNPSNERNRPIPGDVRAVRSSKPNSRRGSSRCARRASRALPNWGFRRSQQEDWRFTNVAPDCQAALQAGLPGLAQRPDPGSRCRLHLWPAARRAGWSSSTATTLRSCLPRPAAESGRASSAAWLQRWLTIRRWSRSIWRARRRAKTTRSPRSTRPSSRTAALSMCLRASDRRGAHSPAVHLDRERGRAPRHIRAT